MHNNSRYSLSFLLLFILILLSYSNTLNSSWHLDDYQSILNNRFLHIKEIGFKSLSDVVSQRDYGNFTRPVSQLTFALNWYFGKDNVKGYHLVNTGIHIITAFFLFNVILMLFKTPNLINRFSGENGYFIALLSTLLWAVNPVQTQAVTYIVQRMTSMAAMFYIAGIFLYLKARLSGSQYKQNLLFFCVFLAFMLALGTKENAITLPFSLILIEVVFFQDTGRVEIRRKYLLIAAILAVIIIAGIFIFTGTDAFNILKDYENRKFTPGERLLTQARVLIYYITLIFYPAPTRLSIEHDIDISVSLFSPWTTMPSIIIIICIIGAGIWKIRKQPLLSFTILFFFLNQIIESSIIGLELIFEHRNYLPSFFLFVPVGIGLKRLLDRYRDKKSIFYLISAFIILLITGYVSGTYIRNMSWASEVSLMSDALRKAPESARALNNFTKAYYESGGEYVNAIEGYHKALYLKTHNKYYNAFILNNIAGVYYHLGDYIKAREFWEKAVQIYPAYDFARYGLAMVSVREGELEKAYSYLEEIVSGNRENTDVLNMKGIILFYKGKHNEALSNFKKGVSVNSDEIKSSINIGAVYSLTGEYEKAVYFLNNAHSLRRDNVMALLWLIETGLRANDYKSADLYIEKIGSLFKTDKLVLLAGQLSAKKYSEDGILTPVFQGLIADKIYKLVEAKGGLINIREKPAHMPYKND